MGQIIAWTDATARYPELDKLPNINAERVQDRLVLYAEAAVHARLSSKYSVPFSSNNITARDLATDELFVQNISARQPKVGKEVRDMLNKKYDMLLAGEMVMCTSSGDMISPTGSPVWSSTEGYHPAFGMGDIGVMAVSSSQLIDEDEARGGIGEAI